MSSDARARAYHPALNALGLIIMIFGLLMSFPLIVSAALGDGATSPIVSSLRYFRDEYEAHLHPANNGCPFDPAASTLFAEAMPA